MMQITIENLTLGEVDCHYSGAFSERAVQRALELRCFPGQANVKVEEDVAASFVKSQLNDDIDLLLRSSPDNLLDVINLYAKAYDLSRCLALAVDVGDDNKDKFVYPNFFFDGERKYDTYNWLKKHSADYKAIFLLGNIGSDFSSINPAKGIVIISHEEFLFPKSSISDNAYTLDSRKVCQSIVQEK
jgi:hypothetical protein